MRLVALLAEGVDRNRNSICSRVEQSSVALLAEGVDRNLACYTKQAQPDYVALLAEGVDRNSCPTTLTLVTRCRPPRGGRG